MCYSNDIVYSDVDTNIVWFELVLLSRFTTVVWEKVGVYIRFRRRNHDEILCIRIIHMFGIYISERCTNYQLYPSHNHHIVSKFFAI